MEKLLDIKQASEALNICQDSLRAGIREGAYPSFFKKGKKGWSISEADLEMHLEHRKFLSLLANLKKVGLRKPLISFLISCKSRKMIDYNYFRQQRFCTLAGVVYRKKIWLNLDEIAAEFTTDLFLEKEPIPGVPKGQPGSFKWRVSRGI